MVGLSSRFFNRGYEKPKYQLPLNGKTVFHYVVKSFEKYFKSDMFIFLCRSDYEAKDFIRAELMTLGVEQYEIMVFEKNTRGQAETVYEGLKDIAVEDELFIFNIDTFRPGFIKPPFLDTCDGFLEVFKGEGDHWSFVESDYCDIVKKTAEKKRISDLCSDGLYFFKNKFDFNEAFEDALENHDTVNGEFYIAPLYNYMIKNGKSIKYHLISKDDINFCGTPDEYENLIFSGLHNNK